MKKPCTACGKQIPSVALDCVFCGARQPAGEGAVSTAPDLAATSMTDPTLVGFRAGELAGAPAKPLLGMPTGELNAAVVGALAEQAATNGAAEPANGAASGDAKSEAPANGASSSSEAPANGASSSSEANEPTPNGGGMPSQAKLTGVLPAVKLPLDQEDAPEPSSRPASETVTTREMKAVSPRAPESAEEARRSTDEAEARADERPFSALSRTIMGVGGAVLVALFFMPWHGVSSWTLLETLGGADFVRQLFYLTGGIVLVTSALLPVPFAFRALIGASVAATPVLLGAGGMIEGWRGVVAALAILGLPATHLLRARAKSSGAARALVLVAVAAVAVLYVAPVNSVVPLVGVFKMIFSGEIGPAVMGIFILIPLVFAFLSLLGLMGRDLTDVGVLLSVLSLLWAPLVVALRGLLMEDGTQVYIAVALLWASATAALSLAQLLSLAARDPHAT